MLVVSRVPMSRLLTCDLPTMAQVVRYRCEKLGALDGDGTTPVVDCMFSRDEPKTGTDGTLSWTVDVYNPATGEDFVLGLKEIAPLNASIDNIDKLISKEADVDLPTAITKLNQVSLAYQAALQSTSNIMKLSLLDYLR